MSIECGSQAPICDLPIRVDTYKGCSHGCKYCFVTRKTDISKIEPINQEKSIIDFNKGIRNKYSAWFDKPITLHWGGMSDPFQPCEIEHKTSLRALEAFVKTQHSFIVSTKGTNILCRDDYVNLLKQCNAVVQISMVSSKYDKFETGAPSFLNRLKDIEKITNNAKRINIRVQPYIPEVLNDVIENIKIFKNLGINGLTLEGMKYLYKEKNTEKFFGDFVFKKDLLKKHFEKIKEECHKYDLKFYSGENRLRSMSDDLCCCGVENLPGFITNKYNLNHIKFGKPEVLSSMLIPGSAYALRCITQKNVARWILEKKTFKEIIDILLKTSSYDIIQ